MRRRWSVSTSLGYGGEIEIDLTLGGAVRDLMKEMGTGEVAATGTVVEVDPPHCLVQTCWRPGTTSRRPR